MSFGNSDDFGGDMQPKPKKSNALWWILGILAVVTVGGALLCCGGFYYVVSAGTQAIAAEAKRVISSDPMVQEHVGDITEINVNFSATSATGAPAGGDGGGDADAGAARGSGNMIVFDIKGEKGTGQLEVVVEKRQDAAPIISSSTLILPNGERHELELAAPPTETAPPQTVDVEETPEAETNRIQPAEESLPTEDAQPTDAQPAAAP